MHSYMGDMPSGQYVCLSVKDTGSGIDPEINTIGAAVNGTGSIGIDNLGTPSTKGFDISFKLTF